MYSLEEKIKAVKLLIQYDMSFSDVRKKLSYPSKEALRNWYQEYKKNGELYSEYLRKSKYSSEEKLTSVTYYL